MNIERLERALLEGGDMEELLDGISWKEFEGFCAGVFERHGWEAKRNLRFRSGRMYEIDVLAVRGGSAFAVDCKHWGARPGKASGLRRAAEMQAERADELAQAMPEFREKKVRPLIVTMLHEDICSERGVWIVPALRLNSFLLGFEGHLE